MSAPNYFSIVDETANEFPELLRQNTEQSILAFMQILGPRLKAADDQWGYLTKTPGEKHLTLPNGQFISVDSFIYRATQQVVDTLTNAVEVAGSAGPAWQEKPKRPDNNWYPISGDVPPTPPSTDCNCKAEIANLQNQINALTAKINQGLTGRKIALQAEANDRWLCADREYNAVEPPVIANRDAAGPWETFIILEK
jgi:hypothetical protein